MSLAIIAIAAAATAAGTPAASVAPPAGAGACCFVNDGYAGVCRVAPAEQETCEGILTYLNTPNTVGKTYCNSTRLRGGWRSVSCPPPPTPGQAAARRETGYAAAASRPRQADRG